MVFSSLLSSLRKRFIYKKFMKTMSYNSEQLLQILKDNSEKIISGFEKRKNDITKYLIIKTKFDNGGNIVNDLEFRKTYKTFYVMRSAGLTDEYFLKYFTLLNTRIYDKQNKLSIFLTEMSRILTRQNHNSIQLSFATKALHTTNNNLPIYDKHVANFFQIKIPTDTFLPMEDRIKMRQRIYNELVSKFNDLLLKIEAKKYLDEIRSVVNIPDKINNAKLLDFIIWLYGSVAKK